MPCPAGLSGAELEARRRSPTIGDLIVWHECDKNRWRGDTEKVQALIDDYMGWGTLPTSAPTT